MNKFTDPLTWKDILFTTSLVVVLSFIGSFLPKEKINIPPCEELKKNFPYITNCNDLEKKFLQVYDYVQGSGD